MPAYGKNLNPAETTALVAFLETLHPAGQRAAGCNRSPWRSAEVTRRVVTVDGRDRRVTGGGLPSPVAHLDHHLLTAHMAQHLILMLVAAPLILPGSAPCDSAAATLLRSAGFAGSFTVIFWHIPDDFPDWLSNRISGTEWNRLAS